MARSKKHIQNKREGRWTTARFDDVLPRQADDLIGVYKGIQYAANTQHGVVYFRRPNTCWSYCSMSIGEARRLVGQAGSPIHPSRHKVDYGSLIDYETYIAYSL